MSSQILVNTRLVDDQWIITATVQPGGTLPLNIFVYNNTGTTTLGSYIGVCNLEELTRLQTWAGAAIPEFGNRFVKYGQAKITIASNENPEDVVTNLTFTAGLLSQQILSQGNVTNTYTITP
jgi:hypothetical protein